MATSQEDAKRTPSIVIVADEDPSSRPLSPCSPHFLSPQSSQAFPSLGAPTEHDLINIPPSPTLAHRSSVHFQTSLALRDNAVDASHRHTKSSNATLSERIEEKVDFHELQTHSDTATTSFQNHISSPFGFRPYTLASMLDPKNLSILEGMGGVNGLVAGLRTDRNNGLSTCPNAGVPPNQQESDITKRRRIYGENVLPERKSKSLLQLMLAAFKDKVLILLSIAAFILLVLGLFHDFGTIRPAGEPPDWVEGAAITVAILIVVTVGSLNDWQRERRFKALDDKKKARGVKVIRDGIEKIIDVKQVVVGDIALLEPGEVVPCDGIFLSGHNVKCDESAATGESDAIKKVTYEECIALRQQAQKSAQADCFVISGSKVLDGVGKDVVVAVGQTSLHGRITTALREPGEDPPPQLKPNNLAQVIAKSGSIAGLLIFTLLVQLFGTTNHHDVVALSQLFRFANEKGITLVSILAVSTALIAVAVPKGLALVVALALAFRRKCATCKKLLVRVLSSCQTMANASSCTGKTDTLTTVVAGSIGVHAKFARQLEENQSQTNPDEHKEQGTSEHANDFSLEQSELTSVLTPQLQNLCNEAIGVNSTAFCGGVDENGDPVFVGSKTETALLKFAYEMQWTDFKEVRDSADVIQMIPFSSERKATGVVVKLPDNRFRVYLKGASEILSKKCTYHVVRKEPTLSSSQHIETASIGDLGADNISRTIISYANQNLRTIALCYRDFEAWPPKNASFNEEREVPYEQLANDLTLIAIVGIEDPLRSVRDAVSECHGASVTVKMCTGDDVFTARSIAAQCSKGGIVMGGPVYRKLRQHEMMEVAPRLQVLARSGGGTNDGPALKTANVGFSMDIVGTEVAKEASDIILMDDNFSSIVKAIIWGRCVNDAVRRFLQFQISISIATVVIAFGIAVSSHQENSVLSAVRLLWINIIMGAFSALVLATDPPSEALLDQKPEKTAPLFSVDMYKQIIFQSLYQIAITLIFYFLGKQTLSTFNDIVMQTLVLDAFVFVQIFNSVNSRRLGHKLNISEGILNNWYFICITLIGIVGGAAFQVTRIKDREWGTSLALGAVSVPLGVLVCLLLNELFSRTGLLGRPVDLPTTNPEAEEGWYSAVSIMRDNLSTFANVRGGRLRSSSPDVSPTYIPRSKSERCGRRYLAKFENMCHFDVDDLKVHSIIGTYLQGPRRGRRRCLFLRLGGSGHPRFIRFRPEQSALSLAILNQFIVSNSTRLPEDKWRVIRPLNSPPYSSDPQRVDQSGISLGGDDCRQGGQPNDQGGTSGNESGQSEGGSQSGRQSSDSSGGGESGGDESGSPRESSGGQSGSGGGSGQSGGDDGGDDHSDRNIAEATDDESEDNDEEEPGCSSSRRSRRRSNDSRASLRSGIPSTRQETNADNPFVSPPGSNYPPLSHSPDLVSSSSSARERRRHPYVPRPHPQTMPVYVASVASADDSSMRTTNRPSPIENFFSLLLFDLPSDYYHSLATLPSSSTLHDFVVQTTTAWSAQVPIVLALITLVIQGFLPYSSQNQAAVTFFLFALSCWCLSFTYDIVMTLLLSAMGEAWLTHAQNAHENAWNPWVLLSLPRATFIWGILCFVIGLVLLIAIDGGITISSSQPTALFGTSFPLRLTFVLVTVLGILPLLCSILNWRRYRRHQH